MSWWTLSKVTKLLEIEDTKLVEIQECTHRLTHSYSALTDRKTLS